jgi:K+-sensing histidine kinase KdpD
MTILVAYVPRPEGQAALDKGIEIAKSRNEHLVVVNASAGGTKEDPSLADVQDFERVQEMLANTDLNAEVKQYVRGKNAVEEISALVESLQASLLIIGLRRRSPWASSSWAALPKSFFFLFPVLYWQSSLLGDVTEHGLT